MSGSADLLGELPHLSADEFARSAYEKILGRAPSIDEREQMTKALLQGEAPTWLLGSLRYGSEGRARGIAVRGLRLRYLAQRLYRVPVVGSAALWLSAVARLPTSLRYLRSLRQLDIVRRDEQLRTVAERFHGEISGLRAELQRHNAEFGMVRGQGATVERHISAVREEAARARADVQEVATRLEAVICGVRDETQHARADVRELSAHLADLRAKLDAIFPPPLDDSLEIAGAPLVAVARERSGIAPQTPVASLSSATRYAMFETVFYESPAVADKQRVYVPYLDRGLGGQFPFLDLGCGRGEFLRILTGEGFRAIGVDINPTSFPALRADGLEVVERDLLAFLESDRGTYAGASLLQVAEHLTQAQIEKMLTLLLPRLAPGGIFILETPNPLSPFALAVFHTDPTHVTPLPPEAMRYAIEAAGFERTRTLFQARVPSNQFAGPDPRAYYGDYAILAWRPAS